VDVTDRSGPRLADQAPTPAGYLGFAAAAREVAVVVRRRQRVELARLHRVLFSGAGERRYGPEPEAPPPAMLGRAVTDGFARVTVAASMFDVADGAARGVAPGPVPAGLVELHVSVVGRHRSLDRLVRLSVVEEQGWARAVFGPAWEDAAYYGGHAAKTQPVPIAHFSLFLDAGRAPTRPPTGWGPLWPLSASAQPADVTGPTGPPAAVAPGVGAP